MKERYIAEEPREIDDYHLLRRIYDYHDRKIGEYTNHPCLDIGFGKKPFNEADYGIEPEERNVEEAPEEFDAIVGSAHDMPYDDNKFDSVVAKRVIHHFDPKLRNRVMKEVNRVLNPGGSFIIIEGTPGWYRKFTKRIGFATGILGKDNDDYGHLSPQEVRSLIEEAGFDLKQVEKLGSPLIPLSIIKSERIANIYPLHLYLNIVRWWTFFVAKAR